MATKHHWRNDVVVDTAVTLSLSLCLVVVVVAVFLFPCATAFVAFVRLDRMITATTCSLADTRPSTHRARRL